ncbi:PilW family protein [Hydrogenophaga electricum]|nr:PilW family protein [Hydrogenophaga electricum]
MKNKNSNPHLTSRNAQRGVTLVELMVAMVIGIFLLGAVAIIYVSTSSSARSSTFESQMNEDATLALEILAQQIRLAGFSELDGTSRKFSGIAVRGCDTAFQSSNADFGSLTCGSTGSSAIAIQYEATTRNTPKTSDDKPSNCSYSGIDTWNHDGLGTTADIALADNRYFVQNDNTNSNAPTLYCQGRTGATFEDSATALIPNIESIQIKYGVTLEPEADQILPHQITAYQTASEVEALTGNWSRVAAVQICLTARSSAPVSTGGDSKENISFYVDCDGNRKTDISDRYLRRAYTTTVQLRNMRPGVPLSFQLDGTSARNPWSYEEVSE